MFEKNILFSKKACGINYFLTFVRSNNVMKMKINNAYQFFFFFYFTRKRG